MIYNALFDSTIRLTTIVIRGSFIFATAKYLSAEEFGLYVAISAAIALMQYVVAGDFSYIAHREFFSNRISFDELLRTQAALMAFIFIIAIPFALFLLPSDIEQQIKIMAIFILAFESLTSEIQRHLVAISRFSRANAILFIKSAGWMLPTLIIFSIDNRCRNIEFIVNAWVVGLIASLLVGLVGIKAYIFSKSKVSIWLLRIYFEKITIILIGTLAARSLFSVDRIIVEKIIGTQHAGIYGLFVGIAAAFVAILDAGVLTRSYPALVRVGETSRFEHRALSKKIEYNILFLTISALVIYKITIPLFLTILKKPEYLYFSEIGLLLIAAYGIYSLSFPANCRLYALGKDKLITALNLFSLTPLVALFHSSSVNVDQVAIMIVACAILHYISRQLALRLIHNKVANLLEN